MLTPKQAIARVRKYLRKPKRTVRVTISVTPRHDDDTLKHVSDLVVDLLRESCAGDETDTFQDVVLIHAQESFE